MSKDLVVVTAMVPLEVRDALREDADKNNRTPGKHIAWVLERYMKAQEEDGA